MAEELLYSIYCGGFNEGYDYYCPHCKKFIGRDLSEYNELNFCQKCGKAIKFPKINYRLQEGNYNPKTGSIIK